MYATVLKNDDLQKYMQLTEKRYQDGYGRHGLKPNFQDGFHAKALKKLNDYAESRISAHRSDGFSEVKEFYDDLCGVINNKFHDEVATLQDYVPRLNRASDVARDAEELEALLVGFMNYMRTLNYPGRQKPQAVLIDGMNCLLSNVKYGAEFERVYKKAYAAVMRRATYYQWLDQSIDTAKMVFHGHILASVASHIADSERYVYNGKDKLSYKYLLSLFDIEVCDIGPKEKRKSVFPCPEYINEDVYRYMLSSYIAALCGLYAAFLDPVHKSVLAGYFDELRDTEIHEYVCMQTMLVFAAKLYAKPHREDWLTCPMIELLLDLRKILQMFLEGNAEINEGLTKKTITRDRNFCLYEVVTLPSHCMLYMYNWSDVAKSTRSSKWSNALSMFRMWPFIERSIEDRRNHTPQMDYEPKSQVYVLRNLSEDAQERLSRMTTNEEYTLPNRRDHRSESQILIKNMVLDVRKLKKPSDALPEECFFIKMNRVSNAVVPMFFGRTKYGADCVLVPSSSKICRILGKLYGMEDHDDLQRESIVVNAMMSPEGVGYNLLFCDVFNAVYDKDVSLTGFMKGDGGEDTSDTHPDNIFKQFLLY